MSSGPTHFLTLLVKCVLCRIRIVNGFFLFTFAVSQIKAAPCLILINIFCAVILNNKDKSFMSLLFHFFPYFFTAAGAFFF